MKYGYVYILASAPNGTLYIGVTSDLLKRTWQHKDHAVKGFTQKYDVVRLVWYEQHETIEDAIYREKQLKKWERAWKIRLIVAMNSEWKDLYEDII